MYRSRPAKGFTLIELMIGLLVGLIVLSAVIYTFLSTLRSSKDILNSARLNRDASILTDLIVGELRRTGYYPVSLSLSGSDSGFGTGEQDLFVSSDNGCVLYAYYDDGIASVARRGFHWDSTSYELDFGTVASITSSACATLSVALNDSTSVKVKDFDVSIDSCSDAVGNAVSTALCQGSNAVTTYSRSLAIDIIFENANDGEWKSNIEETVKLPNDLSPGTL